MIQSTNGFVKCRTAVNSLILHLTVCSMQWNSLLLLALKFLSAHRTSIDSPFPCTWSAPGVHCYTVVILSCVPKPMLRAKKFIAAAMGAEKFLPFHCKDTTPCHTGLFSGFTNETNSLGSLSSRFYHLSKDHLQHLHTFQWKGWENMAKH